MLKFNKVFNSKVISFLVAGLFLLNSTVYGIELPGKSYLRPSPLANSEQENRLRNILLCETLDPAVEAEGKQDPKFYGKTKGKFITIPKGDYPELIHSIMESKRGVKKRPLLIGIGGGAGAGKTIFAQDILMEKLGKGKVLYISEDDFSGIADPDDRTLLHTKNPQEVREVLQKIRNGEKLIAMPERGKRGLSGREELVNLEGIDFIVYDGLYAINNAPAIGNYVGFMDVALYLQETDVQDRKMRRYKQEANKENPRTGEVMDKHWENIQIDHFQYVEPSRENAHFVIHIDASFQYVVEEVLHRTSDLPSISALLSKARQQSKAILFVCPHSQLSLDAAVKVAKEKKWPLIFLYSRNQVDNDEFGAGHVFNWNQERCVYDINKRLKELGYDRKVYFYRDHGGPWQRTEEISERMPEKLAMKRAKDSLLADLESGFVALHIDASKSPFKEEWDEYGKVQNEIMIRRTVELIKFIEQQRELKNLPPVTYEVGGEWERWDKGSAELMDDFLTLLNRALSEEGLTNIALNFIAMSPSPNTLAGGIQESILDKELITALVRVANKHGMAVKYHNGDYMSTVDRARIAELGINAVNIAPEFSTIYQTNRLMEFAKYEETLLTSGDYNELNLKQSHFREIFTGAVLGMLRKRREDIEPIQLDTLIELKGHYAYHVREVVEAIQILKRNIKMLHGKIPLEKQRELGVNLNWDSMQEKLEQAMRIAYTALEEGIAANELIIDEGGKHYLVTGNCDVSFLAKVRELLSVKGKQFQIIEDKEKDYIGMSCQVAENISQGKIERAVLVADSESAAMCMSIVANRFRNVRAALCRNVEQAEHTRAHNDANILIVNKNDIDGIVPVFLDTEFKTERESKVDSIEVGYEEPDKSKSVLRPKNTKVIPIASDYGGFKLKGEVIEALAKRGYQVLDLGTFSADEGSYPDYGKKVAGLVSSGISEKGIVICKTGIGMSMVVNRYPGVRGALCIKPDHIRTARENLDANILVMSGFYSTETLQTLNYFLTGQMVALDVTERIETVTKQAKEQDGELARGLGGEAELKKKFPYATVKFDEARIDEFQEQVVIVNYELFLKDQRVILAMKNAKEQLGDKIKFVLALDDRINKDEFYEIIGEATEGEVDLKSLVENLVVSSKGEKAQEVIEVIKTKLGLKTIRIIGPSDWAGSYKELQLEDLVVVICDLGGKNEVSQGDLAILATLHQILKDEELKELITKRGNKNLKAFNIESVKVEEELVDEKYLEAMSKFN